MEAVIAILKNLLRNNRIVFVVGVVLGTILGLIFAWGLWPVNVVDTTPEVMRADLQRDFLRMTIDSYNRTGDVNTAMARWDNLGEAAGSTFIALRNDPGYLDPAQIEQFGTLVQSVKGTAIQPTAETPQGGGALSQIVIYASITVVVILLAVGGLYVWRLFRKGSGVVTPTMEAASLSKNVEKTDYQALGVAPPIVQSMTTYVAGYDLYDESFSIDTQGGKYLGEYGVGIGDKIGVGEPKKVAALEIWLFEQNDVNTATKVLLAEHAYNDPGIRARLEPKGELVLIKQGEQVLLETANLQLLATVVDLEYGMGAMPANSHFQRVTLELAVWPRSTK